MRAKLPYRPYAWDLANTRAVGGNEGNEHVECERCQRSFAREGKTTSAAFSSLAGERDSRWGLDEEITTSRRRCGKRHAPTRDRGL